MGAGGVSPPPRPPREPNVGFEMFYCAAGQRGFAVGGALAENIPPRGADMPVCGVQRFSAKTYGAAAFAARICRTRSARLLAASEPPLRRLLRRRRDSPPLPAHGRCRPVTPASLLFPRKEVKQEKRRLFQQKDSMSLRHKPSMRHKKGCRSAACGRIFFLRSPISGPGSRAPGDTLSTPGCRWYGNGGRRCSGTLPCAWRRIFSARPFPGSSCSSRSHHVRNYGSMQLYPHQG